MAKLYAGGQIRTLRTARGLTQADMARALDLSTSYLNQLENDQRPLTASVLVQLTTVFGVDAAFFSGDAERRTAAELAELIPDISERDLAAFARSYPAIADGVRSIPARLRGDSPNPYEATRNFFQKHGNYFHGLDTAAEALAANLGGRQLRLTRLAAALDRDFGYPVRFNQQVQGRSVVDTQPRQIRLRAGLTLSLIHI